MNGLLQNEDIKGRMLRHISSLWGVKNSDALDPLVKLLVEALAGELQKTHQEIHTFEKRILEKMAVLMTPGVLSAPYCAHGVVQAIPVEKSEIADMSTAFFTRKKKEGEKDGYINLYFTPVNGVKLYDAEIRFIGWSNKLYTLDSFGQKVPFVQRSASDNRNIWIGLYVNPDLQSLADLNFFFDFKNTGKKNNLFQIVQRGSWYIADNKINTCAGLNYQDGNRTEGIFNDYDPMRIIEKEVKNIYHPQFIRIEDNFDSFKLSEVIKSFPDELKSYILPSDQEKFQEKLLWLRLELPLSIDDLNLNDLHIACNAFPVVNRYLNEYFHRLKGISNIIPVTPKPYEYFLSIEELSDSSGKSYLQIPYSGEDHGNIGTYSVRKGGAERIDARSAKEFLLYLTDMIRDESAAYASYGQETINNSLKDLDKILAQLEQRIKKNPVFQEDSSYYVSVEYRKRQESFFVKYWATNSVHANGIHVGTKLSLYKDTQFKEDTALLLTTTVGGKKGLEPGRHIDAYKYAMLSHNKIVTVEDVKAFCYYELGNKIEKVTVQKVWW